MNVILQISQEMTPPILRSRLDPELISSDLEQELKSLITQHRMVHVYYYVYVDTSMYLYVHVGMYMSMYMYSILHVYGHNILTQYLYVHYKYILYSRIVDYQHNGIIILLIS